MSFSPCGVVCSVLLCVTVWCVVCCRVVRGVLLCVGVYLVLLRVRGVVVVVGVVRRRGDVEVRAGAEGRRGAAVERRLVVALQHTTTHRVQHPLMANRAHEGNLHTERIVRR